MSKINHRVGNLVKDIDLDGPLKIIIQQVNAQGVMGAGFAKDIRERWPVIFSDYLAVVGPSYSQPNSGKDLLGKVIYSHVEENIIVASIVGQQFFGRENKCYTSYDALAIGLEDIAKLTNAQNVEFHFPLLGCGLGGASWSIVEAIIDTKLKQYSASLYLWRL